MPLLDMATLQPSFKYAFRTLKLQTPLCKYDRHASRKVKILSATWKVFTEIPRKVYFDMGHLKMQGALLIRAVATQTSLKLPLTLDSNPQVSQDLTEGSTETNESEKLRRDKISKANKGNIPWNKGRKHSPETLERIRERTRQAMQDPKVKMKVENFGHSRRQRQRKLMSQEKCRLEWQNLIADASRKGYAGEGELRWNSDEMSKGLTIKSSKQRVAHWIVVHWTVEMEKLLCNLLIDQLLLGNRRTSWSSFTKPAWAHVREELNRRTKQNLSMWQIKTRYYTFRTRYKEINKILGVPGFGWSAREKTVTALEGVWEQHLKEYPKHRRYRADGCPIYDELSILFGDTNVASAHTKSSTQVKLPTCIEVESFQPDSKKNDC